MKQVSKFILLIVAVVITITTSYSMATLFDPNNTKMPSYQTQAAALTNGFGIQNGVVNDCPLCRAKAALNTDLYQTAIRSAEIGSLAVPLPSSNKGGAQ